MTKFIYRSKYQLFINGREKIGIEILKNPENHSVIIHKQLMMFLKIWKTIIQHRKGEY